MAKEKSTKLKAASREVPVDLRLFNVGWPLIYVASIFRAGCLGDGHFFVDAEDISHGIANFAEGGICLHRLVNIRHGVFRAGCRFAQRSEAARDLVVRAFGAKLTEALGLAFGDGFVHL